MTTLFDEIEITAHVWQFEMQEPAAYPRDSGWSDYPGTFSMIIAPATGGKGRDFAGFYADNDLDSLGQDLLDGTVNSADLALPWSIFVRCVAALAARDEVSTISAGTFRRDGDDHVVFTTACGQRYRIRRDVLEGLAEG